MKLLSEQLNRLLGYSPQVDVFLAREDGRRLWVQLEISRGELVAGHAHFATAHLFEPQAGDDTFLSMVSPLAPAGRRNLAANMVLAMRRLGIAAYQTSLLPHHSKAEIARLASLSAAALARERLDIPAEIRRALSVALPVLKSAVGPIHFAANVMEVMLNVYRWNLDLQTDAGRARWGQHTVATFVYDPRFRHFAPARFAAHVPVAPPGGATGTGLPGGMSVAAYAQAPGIEAIVAGRQARHHLIGNLAMRPVGQDAAPELYERFMSWLATCRDAIAVSPAGPQLILPPAWF